MGNLDDMLFSDSINSMIDPFEDLMRKKKTKLFYDDPFKTEDEPHMGLLGDLDLEMGIDFGKKRKDDYDFLDMFGKEKIFFNINKYILEDKLLDKINLKNNNDFIDITYDKLDKYLINITSKYNSTLFSKIKTSNLGFTSYLADSAMITADNIAEYVFPLVEYIHVTQPDAIIACDRGARLIGLATFMLYRELHGRLPTYDGTVKFRRISKSNSQAQTQRHLAPLAKELLKTRDKPTVLVLDDWIVSGATKDIVRESFDNLSSTLNWFRKRKGRIGVKFGVLQGSGGDVSGYDGRSNGFAGTVDWHDNASLIGVNYNGMSPQVVSTSEHRDYRRRIRESVNRFVNEKMMQKAA